MKFNKFEIHAKPFIADAYCVCGHGLTEVSNGFFSKAMFCLKCEKVYELKLVKVSAKRITKNFLEQCRKEAVKNAE